jgi:hypothetical protein
MYYYGVMAVFIRGSMIDIFAAGGRFNAATNDNILQHAVIR